MSVLVEAALAYAAAGVLVFPCLPDKSPACPHGFKDASNDPAVVQWLFERAPRADRIGMPTGAVTGISVIDVDPAGNAWLQNNRYRLPSTREHSTPRGGRHLFYWHPPGLRCSAGKVGAGIDIRADGGFIIGWGPGYEVVNNAAVAAFPAWVLDGLAWLERLEQQRREAAQIRFRHSRRGGGDQSKLVDFVSRAPQGERNKRLFWSACRAGAAGCPGEALIAAAMALGLSQTEARRTVESGLKTGGRP